MFLIENFSHRRDLIENLHAKLAQNGEDVEDLKEKEDDVNVLLIDANFSPVLNVLISL